MMKVIDLCCAESISWGVLLISSSMCCCHEDGREITHAGG